MLGFTEYSKQRLRASTTARLADYQRTILDPRFQAIADAEPRAERGGRKPDRLDRLLHEEAERLQEKRYRLDGERRCLWRIRDGRPARADRLAARSRH